MKEQDQKALLSSMIGQDLERALGGGTEGSEEESD
jgi:hypothetical protein